MQAEKDQMRAAGPQVLWLRQVKFIVHYSRPGYVREVLARLHPPAGRGGAGAASKANHDPHEFQRWKGAAHDGHAAAHGSARERIRRRDICSQNQLQRLEALSGTVAALGPAPESSLEADWHPLKN